MIDFQDILRIIACLMGAVGLAGSLAFIILTEMGKHQERTRDRIMRRFF